MRIHLSLLAAAAALSINVSALAQTLKAADVHPAGYPTVVAVENMGKRLEAATQGRITSVSNEIESRYGDSVNPGSGNYDCVGTALTLDGLQAHVRAGVAVTPGTGTTPPSE